MGWDLLQDFDRFVVEDELIIRYFERQLMKTDTLGEWEAFAYHSYVIGKKFILGLAVIRTLHRIQKVFVQGGQGFVGKNEKDEVEIRMVLNEKVQSRIIQEPDELAEFFSAGKGLKRVGCHECALRQSGLTSRCVRSNSLIISIFY